MKVEQGIIFYLWVCYMKRANQMYSQKYCQSKVIHTDLATQELAELANTSSVHGTL